MSEQQVDKPRPRYSRVLLKLSGEALAPATGFGIDHQVLSAIAAEIKEVADFPVQVAVVIGGGNLMRGASYEARGMDAGNDFGGRMETGSHSRECGTRFGHPDQSARRRAGPFERNQQTTSPGISGLGRCFSIAHKCHVVAAGRL